MNKTTGVIAIVALLVGLMGGYWIAGRFSGVQDPRMSMMSSLSNKEGEAFEKAFIDEMIRHHEDAVQMSELVLKKSQRPELLQLAKNIVSSQASEIGLMRGWKAQWYGE
jgi:uncharacterized protein (DUF305 family)